MDPLSLALAAAGLGKSFLDKSSAEKTGQANIAAQQANLAAQKENTGFQQLNIQQQLAMLADAIRQTQDTSNNRLRVAGAPKTDQFGNTTYYDPTTGQWRTQFTEQQQRLIDQGQQRQERTNLRGAQASEDYNTERSGYLNLRPKSEAESYAEIARLITQARGEGDRALGTLVNRQELRQKGNMPVINTGPITGSDAGKRLAETMLQARTQALNETGTREQQHSQRYLPGMAAFEKTANTVAPIDPTGQQIVGMAQQGASDVSGVYGDLIKSLLSAYGTGSGAQNAAYGNLSSAYSGQNAASNALGTAYTGLEQVQSPKNEIAQYAALINAMKPNSAQAKLTSDANKLAAATEPQISGTTYTASGLPSSGTSTSPYNFALDSLDTPPEYTYKSPAKTSFNDRWYF